MPAQFTKSLFRAALMLLAWTLAADLPAHAQGMCHAPAQGLPCGPLQTATPTEPGLHLGIGNPIHAATGLKIHRDVDLPAPLDARHPSLVRIHRLDDPVPGAWGAGWRSEYDLHLAARGRGWRIRQADGTVARFGADGRAADATHGRIEVLTSGHRWRWPDDTTLDFDASGRLSILRPAGRRPVHIHRHAKGALAGFVARITQGRGSLHFAYDTTDTPARITHIDTPAGRLRYQYDQGPDGVTRLRAVIRPDGAQRHYLYENQHQSGHPHAITGMTLSDHSGRTTRVRSWAYDAAGRVTTAIPGPFEQAPGRLDIRYADQTGEAGLTQVLNADGSRTDLRHTTRNGRSVLRSVQGVGCPGCAPPGVQASHDDHGRLTGLNSLRLDRDDTGRIVRIQPDPAGWPGLMIGIDHSQQTRTWRSTLTGVTHIRVDTEGRPNRIDYANGDWQRIRHDHHGRPIALHAGHAGGEPVSTTLNWRGRLLVRIEHPAETEFLHHDEDGRVIGRRVQRPHPSGELRYEESFAYDAQGRLVRHALPEGGVLHYAWGNGGRLAGIQWENTAGERHTVIQSLPGVPGYRYGNGLHLESRTGPGGHVDTLLLRDGQTIRWLVRRQHTPTGLVHRAHEDVPEAGFSATRHYAYDTQGRLAGLREHVRRAGESATVRHAWLAWDENGSLAATRHHDGTGIDAKGIPLIRRDASGLPTHVEGLEVRYSPQRRPAAIEQAGRTLAEYVHNGRGHQIRQTRPSGQTERYYQDNRIAAVWHRPPAGSPAGGRGQTFGISQRYIHAHDVPVGLIQHDADGVPQLYAIHADLLGMPRIVTDEARRIRWLADVDAGGKATVLTGDLHLDLRLPGQFHDAATGWHDNVFRNYLPEAMHYLEPDPLGPVPGQQALGYAAQQPMRHVDPLGLLLMAFDGTRNDRATMSNVWKLSQRYADGPVHYHAGPGNKAYLDWDAITAAGAGQIIRNQWQSLLNSLAQAQRTRQSVPIDILGYSRGAALARHFANQIALHTRNGWFSIDDPLRGMIGLCIDLRFMGLFDSVAQFGLLGAQNAGYELGIAQAWQWVAHAVALHEYRLMLPLLSADGADHHNTVEAPFIGAHADIGGGVRLDDAGQPQTVGDLSDVALNWILWQARAALVPFDALALEDRQVTQALLHDERPGWQRILSDGDRAIQDSHGMTALMSQGEHTHLGQARRDELETFIRRLDGWRHASGNVVGEVDMQGYGQWLESALGLRM